MAQAVQKYSHDTPFRAAIMQSGTDATIKATSSFTAFDSMAKAVNCTQTPGPARLSCLKGVPADAIHAWANGPQGLPFSFTVDKLVDLPFLVNPQPVN